jgi:hypothetical protein
MNYVALLLLVYIRPISVLLLRYVRAAYWLGFIVRSTEPHGATMNTIATALLMCGYYQATLSTVLLLYATQLQTNSSSYYKNVFLIQKS